MLRSARSSLRTYSVLAPLLALASATAATAPGSEPSLRTSRTLSSSGPMADIERALLRLEHRAGQSRVAESETLGEMTARIERMGRTIAELHTLIVAMPSTPCFAAPSPACPPEVATPSRTAGDHWSLRDVSLIAGLSLLLGLLMRWRRTIPVESPLGTNGQTVIGDRTKAPPTERQAAPHSIPGRPATAAPVLDDANGDAKLSLELADVMVSMGLGGGAVQTLEGHIRQHPRHALFHWLKLLEVYRRFGQHEEFEKAGKELQRHFNIAPPSWHHIVLSSDDPSLEDFPHISTRLQELWPRRSCAEYLNRLIEDNRDGARIGFPPPVVEEILLLMELLRS